MNDKYGQSKKHRIDIAELNNYSKKNVHSSIESTNTKPYDITKMTGKPASQDENNQEG